MNFFTNKVTQSPPTDVAYVSLHTVALETTELYLL